MRQIHVLSCFFLVFLVFLTVCWRRCEISWLFVGPRGSAHGDKPIKLKAVLLPRTPARTLRFQRDSGWSLENLAQTIQNIFLPCVLKLPPRLKTLGRFAVCAFVAKPATLKCQPNKMWDHRKLHICTQTHARTNIHFQTSKCSVALWALSCFCTPSKTIHWHEQSCLVFWPWSPPTCFDHGEHLFQFGRNLVMGSRRSEQRGIFLGKITTWKICSLLLQKQFMKTVYAKYIFFIIWWTVYEKMPFFLTESTRHLEAVHFLWPWTFFETRKWKKDAKKRVSRNGFVGQKGKKWLRLTRWKCPTNLCQNGMPNKTCTRTEKWLSYGKRPLNNTVERAAACFLTLEPKSSGIFLTHPLAVRSGS